MGGRYDFVNIGDGFQFARLPSIIYGAIQLPHH